jgi:hypothetical protein
VAKLTDLEKYVVRKMRGKFDWLHFGLGARIRNDFGPWFGNTAPLDSGRLPDTHPDDTSESVVPAVWERLRSATAGYGLAPASPGFTGASSTDFTSAS